LNEIAKHPNVPKFTFIKVDIVDREHLEDVFSENQFDLVINLAAQAGVRFSLENPRTCIDSNVVGFVNILEGCPQSRVLHLIYASSSSVYGSNSRHHPTLMIVLMSPFFCMRQRKNPTS